MQVGAEGELLAVLLVPDLDLPLHLVPGDEPHRPLSSRAGAVEAVSEAVSAVGHRKAVSQTPSPPSLPP